MEEQLRNDRAMTRDEYYAYVDQHGHTPTWGPCRLEARPGTIRQHDDLTTAQAVA